MSNLFEENKKLAHLINNYTNSRGQKKVNIDSWRKFKTSGLVKRDGKKCYWCPKHVREGDYAGLYVAHSASDHDEWVEHRKEWGKNKKKKSGN